MNENETSSHAQLGGSAQWVEHFQASLARPVIVRGDAPVVLSRDRRKAIACSVREFQLGESSEGRHLIRAAQRYAQLSGDDQYVAALRLFIAEENRHAQELGRFLDLAGIPRARATWPDTVFRLLRRGAGLELSIVVLVTAEIIAKVYYFALRSATRSRVLGDLCTRIQRDEEHHVISQAQRIALLRARHSRRAIGVRVALQRVLLAGTCLVVWRRHGRAMRAGGVGFRRFWRATWREMNAALAHMDPGNYPALVGGCAKPQSGGDGGATPSRVVRTAPRPAASRLRAPAHPPPDLLQLNSEDVT